MIESLSAIAQQWFQQPLLAFNSPLFALTLSVLAFTASNIIYRRCNAFPLLHPTVAGAVIVAIVLPPLNINYEQYLQGNQLLSFLLGPATVALAVPLYQQFHLIRKLAMPILITTISGAAFAALSALMIAHTLGADQTVLLSLAPKSVTTPIAISLATEIHGLAALAAGAVAITAVVAITASPVIFRLLAINDPKIWGFCLGITGHGMGTARAFELNPTAGAFSSLAMCLTGTFSAIIIPLVASALTR